MNNVIFYFTGTGNSLKITKDIAAKSKLPDCSIVSIAKTISVAKSFKPDGIVGFVFPVYYCGIPQIVRLFLEQIDLSAASYVFVIATYGSIGGNGGCIHQAKDILSKKNVQLNLAFYVKTVDNFILWTWDVPSINNQNKSHKMVDNITGKIANCIINKEEHFDWSFVEYIGPIIFGNKRFIKNVNNSDKYFHVGSKCNLCGICIKVCPTKNIIINGSKPEWKNNQCQLCTACLHMCPKEAIEFGKATRNKKRYKNPFIKLEELFNDN
ncbi:iron-sulfur protein [Betaproteobacteria bacterium]|nr:iron-sulfur protein [Betaproteobacteria bacterium]